MNSSIKLDNVNFLVIMRAYTRQNKLINYKYRDSTEIHCKILYKHTSGYIQSYHSPDREKSRTFPDFARRNFRKYAKQMHTY